jgi:putative tricarboxylic transport membrane protein
MRRDTFLKSMAALAAAGALPLPAFAAANVKMMIPANPGGGWDTTGRALGKALQESGAASTRAVPLARWDWPSLSTAAKVTAMP